MKSSRLSPARIARSVVTVLTLTLIQTVGSPLINLATPQASAATLYDNRSNFQQWETWRTTANHPVYDAETTNQITSNDQAFELTPNLGNKAGFIWNTQTVSLSRDFSLSAWYYLGADDGGADGLVFSMRPLVDWPNDGVAGGNNGDWSHWSSNELKVIFDTYQNGSEIAEDHIRIVASKNGADTNYSGSGVKFKDWNGTTVNNVENNTWYPITIKWTGSTRLMSVYSGLNANYLITSATIPASDFTLSEYNWGWMGFTGGAFNIQQITGVNYHVGPTVSTSNTDTTVVDGTSVTLSATYSSSESSPTTRWEYSTDGGTTWISTGTTTNSYTFTATRSLNQRKYRFYVEATAGGSTFSKATDPITLTVNGVDLKETDTALTFNGINQYAQAAENDAFDITGAITIEAWVYQTGFVSGIWNMVVNKEGSYELGTVNGYWYYALSGSTAWTGVNTQVAATLNTWQHVAITRAASTNEVKFYLNGYLAFTGTADGVGTGLITNSNSPFSISAREVPSNGLWKGQLDEIRLFASARTAEEILTDMNTYGPIDDANLRLYFDGNEGSGSKIYNRKAGSNGTSDVTLYNAPTFTDVKSVDPSTFGAYTTVKFPRTYLNSSGGWRVPSGISKMSYLIVAGGGAGGTGDSGYNFSGGGGGGGGVRTGVINSPSGFISAQVGPGQKFTTCKQDRGRNSALLGTAITTISATGGGSGGCWNGTYLAGNSGGSGGGAVAQSSGGLPGSGNLGGYSPVEGFSGGYGQANSMSGNFQSGGGGGGAAAVGGAGSSSAAGNGGAGKVTSFSGSFIGYGGGGGGGTRVISAGGSATDGGGAGGLATAQGSPGTNGQGGGGGGTSRATGNDGGMGVVYVRWLNITKPTYTFPTNAYLNVGMTETFTTNVAADSATAAFTRTFKWESTTPTANGNYTLIKQGTGAANAAFSWVPTDTSTSGSGYLYRLTVTDSDTEGLALTDSSTAYAIINRALVVNGNSTIPKAINLSKSETFTITFGTSTYRPALSPVIPGITLDTSTAGSAVIKIADTMTVGTYYETLTVVDSVSALVVTPLAIIVSSPPNLLNTDEVVANNLLLHLDAGNSRSYIGQDSTTVTNMNFQDLSGFQKNAQTSGTFSGGSATQYCDAPTYKTDFGGYLNFNGTSQCLYVPYLGTDFNKAMTIEMWVRVSSFTAGSAYITQMDVSKNLSFVLGATGPTNTNARFAFYPAGSLGSNYSGTDNVTPGIWKHLVGTYDGANLILYQNGSATSTTPDTAGLSSNASYLNTSGYLIGVGYTQNKYLNGDIASVRIYNRALTANEILQNYNATKERFTTANISLIKPVQKYGNSTVETFTATAGYGADTITLATGNRSGVVWSTAGANTVLKMQETLTAGTIYDTVTVTDSLGQSTYLPIKMTVTKADTLTVTVRNPATNVYTGNAPSTMPTLGITGLVTTDTGTVVPSYKGTTTWGSTCATGGTCTVGETGPGGGRVFKVSGSVIDSATGISSGGIYLELAPIAWNGDPNESAMAWSTDYSNISGTVVTTGSGAENNRKILAAIGSAATAVSTVVNSTFGNQNDWFLPSTSELQEALTASTGWTYGGLVAGRNYWTSTQDTTEGTTTQANTVWSSTGGIDAVPKGPTPYYVRPIRAFSPVYQSSLAPTEVETYTVSAKLNLSSGSLSNYVNVVYETSTLKITQANQNKLTLNLYGAVAGSPFTLQVGGGSGSGEVTETVTAGSTALNCRISNHVLSNDTPSTEQKSCNISITKASSRNYKAETLTATVYFMLFANNQPTGLVGSGSTIAINGATSLTIDTTTPPSITGFSTLTLTLSTSDTLTINGTGFTGSVTIKFWRNKVIVKSSPNTTTLQIPFSEIASLGATSGRVAVITANGEAVSDATLVINP